jgi:dTDP-4-amino-4,6-dideoxygalactose transaminase
MRSRYQFEMLGYNFRLTDVAAAIGLVQLDKLDRNTARRQALAAAYDAAFEGLPIRTPVTPVGRSHVFHQYTIDVGNARDAILADLHAAGVGADVYYPLPVHRQPYIQERGLHADLPITDRAAARTLALPIFPGLTADEQAQVIAAVRESVGRRIRPARRATARPVSIPASESTAPPAAEPAAR